MQHFYLSLALLCAFCGSAAARPSLSDDDRTVLQLDSSTVVTARATRLTPIAYTTLRASELKAAAPGQSLPMTLDAQPSVVSSNEGGTGLGYSKLSIRGVSGSQTNVTLNGITLNDAESQEVFWVNIPSLGSYLGSVQLQRGLGTSNNGPGAFGASINMNTMAAGAPAGAEADISYGSFATRTARLSASSGLLPGGFFLQAAAALQKTDGYLRGAWADVHSLYLAGGWMNARNSLKITLLHGSQHTGITWEGIPLWVYDAGHSDFNPAGAKYDTALYGSAAEAWAAGAIDSYYPNQSDNYRQTHLQLSWIHTFKGLPLTWATTLNGSLGYGYYEQLILDLGGPGVDAVTRDILDNTLLVGRSALSYNAPGWKAEAGLYFSHYKGLHQGVTLSPEATLYENDALKPEINAWARAEWTPRTATLYADLQLRRVRHSMQGPDEVGAVLDFNETWLFLNPRLGLTLPLQDGSKAFCSAALAHREPARSDLQSAAETAAAAAPGVDIAYPKPEKMLDLEAGWSLEKPAYSFSVGVYAMEYFDMLLETGKINFAGYTVKDNTPRAWRRGVEVSGAWQALPYMKLHGNLTLSTNRIKEYTAWLDNYDATWTPIAAQPQVSENYHNTPMLLSPGAVGLLGATVQPWKNARFELSAKYVGRQYWDNTGNADRCVPAYWTGRCSLEQRFPLRRGELRLSAHVDNLLNRRYYAYAWVWRAVVAGAPVQSEGLYPQAPRSGSLRLSWSF